MIDVKNLRVSYGKIEVLHDISLHVNKGEIVTLIGANGAGKSTLLKVLAGIHPANSGTVTFAKTDATKWSTKKRVENGLVLVPEGRRIFKGLSVLENLEIGGYLRKDQQQVKKDIERVFDRFPILKERMYQDAATLSGGEQQMLAIGRAILSRPAMLLLDEPSMGLAPIIIQQIFNLIVELQAEGMTILLIEQNAKMALSIAQRAYVMEVGKIVLAGSGQALLHSNEVQKAYLGG